MNQNDKELVSQVKQLRAKEKEVLYALLLKLGEVDERKLYRDEGYSSFFSYLNEGLGYSKSAAERRVKAARLLKKRPELYQKLASGELSFSALVELGRCQEEQVDSLITQAAGKSHRAVVEFLKQETAPLVKERPKERVRVVKTAPKERVPIFSADSTPAPGVNNSTTPEERAYEIAFQADEEFMRLYQEVKALAGGFSMKEVFKKLLQDYTKRNSPKEKIKRRKARKPKASASTGRHIPTAVRDEVYIRDQGQCTYRAPDGKRCSCKQNLEFDHVIPYSLGGESTAENVRLLCRAHNQLMAERVLGKEFMERRRGG